MLSTELLVRLGRMLTKNKNQETMITKANLECENRTGHNTLGPNANRPLHLLTASSIKGDKVENRQEQNIGKIKDIMINLNDGKIEYMVVEFGGFLGIGEKLFAIPFSKLRLNRKKGKL